MGVAATDPNDSLALFSNSGQSVFIAAPGTDIQTTNIGAAYNVISGTSASAAIVAGAPASVRGLIRTWPTGVMVGRPARMPDPAGTQDQTGNGRINMARALADTGIDFIQPAGAAPVGAGGPFVGPYRAAATNIATTTTLNAISTPLTSGQTGVAFSGRVTVAASDPAPPTGSPVALEFKVGTNCSTGGFTSTATVTVDPAGNFSGSFTAQTAGTYSYRAAYQGDSQGSGGSATNWQQSTSACQTVQVVTSVATTTTMTSSANPSTYGQS